MDLLTAQALTSAQGQALLAGLPPYREADAVKLTTRLRAEGYSPELVAAALTQSRLRAKAVDKFGDDAASMLFTPDALEQATRRQISRRHAQRFVNAGVDHVMDGGCGIGADARSFAAAGLAVTGIEAHPPTAELARYNVSGFASASIVTGDVEDQPAATHGRSAWWFDPARRVSGVADIRGKTKRTFSLAALSPSWGLIQERASSVPAAGAKLSPSMGHGDIPFEVEAEFVSFNGDVLETCLWWGDARRRHGRAATIIREDAGGLRNLEVTQDDADGADGRLATRATLGAYFYEADKALTRSGLVGALTNATGGVEFASGYGYITADSAHDVGLLGRSYQVMDAVPLHAKTLRSYLRERNIGRLTIKKRDVDVDADKLRAGLKLKGNGELTVALVNLDGTRLALVVEPLNAVS